MWSRIVGWWKARSRNEKLAIIAVVFVMWVIGSFIEDEAATDVAITSTSLAAEGSLSEQASDQPAEDAVETPNVEVPPYTISEEDDISVAGATRFRLRVLLEDGATVADMGLVTDDILDSYRDRRPYDAIVIFYHRFEALSNGVFTLGRAEDAPYGDWSRASESVGDYSNFEVVATYREKDWSLAPNDAELLAYATYNRVFDEMDNGVDFLEDAVLIPVVAAELGTSEEEVQAALDKILFWMFDG